MGARLGLESGADGAAIVRAVIGLGCSLKVPAIVKEVEIQGYLIGRPMPVEHCAGFFGSGHPRAAKERCPLTD